MTPFAACRALILLSVLIPAACSFSGAATAEPPNVILILADDLGWSDTTLYGTTEFYRTPNIQRLADRGMLFTRAYSASPLCSPTRASVLTGLAPARHGITAPNCHTPTIRLKAVPGTKAAPDRQSVQPDSVTRLDPRYRTLAEALQKAGYATGHFGKWHLGAEPYSALQHGFDIDVPHWHGPGPAGSYVAPWKFPDFDHDPDVPNQHIEDRMAKEATDFIRSHQNEPFFLNYWMFSVHAPFDAKPALIEKYRNNVSRSDEQRCPTYAAMIESMDDAVGTLLDEIDRLQIADNTIIVLASDNGGNMYNDVEGERPTSNRPLRGGKATMYEGGIRTPAVIVWPGRVVPGSHSDQLIQSMDFYPTLLEMIGIEPAEGQVFDGISILPALKGETLKREGLFTYFPHNPPVPEWMPPSISVHRNHHKLIRIFHAGEQGRHRWKLFDLRADIGEQHDLAESHPELVAQLDSLIEAHLRETQAVVPIRNPDFDPSRYDIALEGVPADRRKRAGKAAREAGRTPVAGWVPLKNVRLQRTDAALRITCVGTDPYLSLSLDRPLLPGRWTAVLRMSSDQNSRGQFFWHERGVKPGFARQRSVTFSVSAGEVRDYELTFSAEHPVVQIRLDPLLKQGTVHLHSMTIRNRNEVRSLF